MSLGFILGTAAKDHQTAAFEQLRQWMASHPDGKIYYLVPNHIKFEQEVKALTYLQKRLTPDEALFSQSNFQVLSFTRLAWYFMQDTKAYQQPRLTAAGSSMILYHILHENKEQLTVYRGQESQMGFIEKLTRQLQELAQNALLPDDLVQMAANLDTANSSQALLKEKLHDLALVYREYSQYIQGKYLDQNDILTSLAAFLNTKDLTNSFFLVSGFRTFTRKEMDVITSLCQKAAEVKVDLILDRPAFEAPQMDDLFYQPANVYYNLCQMAKQKQVKILVDSYAKADRTNEDLKHLESFWIESERSLADLAPEKLVADGIELYQLHTRQEELTLIASKIRQMVKEKGYRYNDFLLLTRHLGAYRNMLKPIFKKAQIPIFIDLEKKVSDHPLVEFLDALFEIDRRNFRYQDLMRLLKTELFLPRDQENNFISAARFRSLLDKTENIILRNGYEGKKAWTKEDWVYYRFGDFDLGTQTSKEQQLTQEINVIRRLISDSLPPFFEKMKKAANGRQASQILVEFLVKIGLCEQLEKWQRQALEEGDLQASQRPAEVWNLFCQMLDEFVENLGEETFKAQEFIKLLDAGFAKATYRRVPTAIDGVAVSETGMVQSRDKKVVFMLGATDMVMPDRIQNTTLLTDRDRELMDGKGELLLSQANTGHILAFEPYLNYLAFLAPTAKLIFTYPQSSDDGTLQLSPYVERIKQHFNLVEQKLTPKDLQVTVDLALPALVAAQRKSLDDSNALPEVWRNGYQILAAIAPTKTKRALAGLKYQNIPVQLTKENAKALYGEELNTSISKLETFYQNPYEYFLRYGLRLKERDVFAINPADKGSYFHDIADQVFKQLIAQKISLKDISKENFDDLIADVALGVAEKPQYAILKSSNKMKFIASRLNRRVKNTLQVIKDQRSYSQLKTIRTETFFGQIGQKQGLKGLDWVTELGNRVRVRGRIDRIDQIDTSQGSYLGIVDYKSSPKDFNYVQAYYGLALQLMAYLACLKQDKEQLLDKKAKIAGACYLEFTDKPLKAENVRKDGLEKARFKDNKYKGLLVNDEALLSQLDADLDNGYSNMYPIYLKKDGSYTNKEHKLLTAEEIDLLLEHSRLLIEKACDMIYAGRIDLFPYKDSQNNGLTYSPYPAIMQFDAMLPENNYFIIPTLGAKDIMEKIKAEQEGK